MWERNRSKFPGCHRKSKPEPVSQAQAVSHSLHPVVFVEHWRWDTLVGAGEAPSSCPGLKAKLLPFYDHISAWNVCCLCDETSQDMCAGDVHRPVLSGLPLGSLKIRPGAPLFRPVPAQWCLHFHPHCVCDGPVALFTSTVLFLHHTTTLW